MTLTNREKKVIQRIENSIREVSDAREKMLLQEKQATDEDEKLACNTHAANLFDIAYEMNWVIGCIKEGTTSSIPTEHGEHGG